jgi:AraC-like DNA-binding protein
VVYTINAYQLRVASIWFQGVGIWFQLNWIKWMVVNLSAKNRTVSAIAVIDLANELVESHDIKALELAELGKPFVDLYEAWKRHDSIQEYRLPEALLVSLWQQVENHDSESDIGLKIGSKVNFKSKGVLANWLSQCNTLSEAFSIFSTNIALLNPSECWEKVEEGDQIKLTVRFSSPQYSSIAIDRSMAALLSWSRALSKEEISPSRVSLVRSAPKGHNKYTPVFGGAVSFGQSENALWLSKKDFSQTIKDANPYLKKLVAKQAMDLNSLLSKNSSRSIVENINLLLRENLARYCQIGETCSAMYVSRSTLFRKLKSEGTSFTQLVKDVRLAHLKKGQLNHVSHNDIAEQLGFQDIGSYYRFRKLNS